MLLSLSAYAILACQGCNAAPAQERGAQTDHDQVSSSAGLTGVQQIQPAPVIKADPQFALSQSQTGTPPAITIAPVIGRESVNANVQIDEGFKDLRLSSSPAVVDFERARKSARITTPARPVRAFDASVSLSAGNAQTGLGFDVGVVPRMSIRKDGQFERRSFGGEIRIGQNFDQRGKSVDAESWYLFAGADGEALVYEPNRERNFTNRMALRDQVTVGDMQAGVSFTRGNGQLSLSYIRREVEYNERGIRGREATEDFAGVSFTLRQ